MTHLTIVIFILGLTMGALAIYIAYNEQTRYKTNLSKNILYFIIVSNIAIALNLFKTYFLLNFTGNLSLAWEKAIKWAYQLSANILLIFVFGVFIALFRALIGETFSKKYKIILFSTWIILNIFFFFGPDYSTYSKLPVPYLINIIINYAGLLIVTFEIIRTMAKNKGSNDPHKKQFVITFCSLFLIIFLTVLLMSILNNLNIISNDLSSLLSSIIIMFFNLFPIIYLRKGLRQFYYDLHSNQLQPINLTRLIDRGEVSDTEAGIIGLICDGLTNQEISDQLFLSLQTIKDYNYRIFKKMKVTNRVQLTKMMLQKD